MTTNFSPERYQSMSYRFSGLSGLKLPVISLGFWQTLGEPGQEEECRKCIYYAFDHGVTHFDLANHYGSPPGNSERVVGKIIKEMPRDELIIASKAGYEMWQGPYGVGGSKKHLVASLDQSLERLGLDYVDIFYHHVPDSHTPLEESLSALDLIVRQGKALYIGVSSYSTEEFTEAANLVRQHHWTPLTIHQPYYNMLHREIETDLLPQTVEAGTGVIAFCPLAGGLLTNRYLSGLPSDSRMGKAKEGQQWFEKHQSEGTFEKLNALNVVAKARGQSLAQLALTWILRDHRITSALIGVSKVEQLAENLKAVQSPLLAEEECQKIERILAH